MSDNTTTDTEEQSRLQSRRDFMKLIGQAMGYGALMPALQACGGGGGGGESGAPLPTAIIIPAASSEYTALKRTSFGVHRDELATIRALGITAYLEQQLDYTSINDGSLETDIATLFPLTTQTPAQLIAGFPDNIGDVAQQMISATQYRQIYSKRQLYEVMVEFWTDHFNIHLLNGLGPTLKPEDDLAVIRTHALGNFRDLLFTSAKSPAMLFYLDNFFNISTAPNENYARELMELHTLGVDGGYTEDDVKEVARCFTGWTMHFPGDPGGAYGTFKYDDTIHSAGAKLVLGNSITTGGIGDGEEVLDILVAHPSTARFIATKLCQRFLSDTPEQTTIDVVAQAFTLSSGDIKSTLRALFASDEFLNTADQKFTRPAEYLAGLVRALAPDTPYPTDNGQLFQVAQSILGQLPYNWPTPDGYPDEQSYWASTGGMLNRWRLSFLSYTGLIPGLDMIQIDYAAMLNGANTLAGIVDALTDELLMRPLANSDRAIILDWLTNEYAITENDPLPPGAPEQISALVAATMISSSYFHLR